jgi:hypothetical protein
MVSLSNRPLRVPFDKLRVTPKINLSLRAQRGNRELCITALHPCDCFVPRNDKTENAVKAYLLSSLYLKFIYLDTISNNIADILFYDDFDRRNRRKI